MKFDVVHCSFYSLVDNQSFICDFGEIMKEKRFRAGVVGDYLFSDCLKLKLKRHPNMWYQGKDLVLVVYRTKLRLPS